LESWQQESAHAIAKRLLVANVACVTVWAIAADNNKEFRNPALLAGLWVFLSMLEIMEAYSQEELENLKAIAQQFLGKLCRYFCLKRVANNSLKTLSALG
jgi:hypothetical protein